MSMQDYEAVMLNNHHPTKHYHVLFGLQGCYMPDSNEVFTSKAEARRYAAWLAKDAREAGYKVVGSAKAGLYLVGEHHMIEISGWCIEDECLEDRE